ncbi:hypothetical protein PROFUN_11550 [Planoprotostelium fungivorum]|uniref:Uncharacterized protein n=1 Tax=Planoprotostelium fungivorum TaxID=1890364 RepID=A0A2P6N9H3_9EUKA|nr:hypothetical protein PROFUN_11550 [Planoprotostelium fungivorum]
MDTRLPNAKKMVNVKSHLCDRFKCLPSGIWNGLRALRKGWVEAHALVGRHTLSHGESADAPGAESRRAGRLDNADEIYLN